MKKQKVCGLFLHFPPTIIKLGSKVKYIRKRLRPRALNRNFCMVACTIIFLISHPPPAPLSLLSTSSSWFFFCGPVMTTCQLLLTACRPSLLFCRYQQIFWYHAMCDVMISFFLSVVLISFRYRLARSPILVTSFWSCQRAFPIKKKKKCELFWKAAKAT